MAGPAMKKPQAGICVVLLTAQTWGKTGVVLICKYDGAIPYIRERITKIKWVKTHVGSCQESH